MNHKYTNALATETSPYLLQHAHNPVNWMPWNQETLALAKKENKPILISIGYAACHWCHVMEEESFEDEEVAALMNTNFINIKVDREERPDVDQVYMNAVQLMTGSGGWPLNVVALPDGRPFWGGTYFRKKDWMASLEQLIKVYEETPDKVKEYAANLEHGIKSMDLVTKNTEAPVLTRAHSDSLVNKWSKYFDRELGGTNRSPKFMMPNNYEFLLRYAFQTKDSALIDYVNTTLTKMAYGGVYDQVGGGFCRYSTDMKWHIPHFEKMLYDNAQLVSLYAQAYAVTKNPLYKEIVQETLAFIARELTGKEGVFYSSLDADSNNEQGALEEGAYYVWKKEALQKLVQDDFKLFEQYYNINALGLWEHQNYVLIRSEAHDSIAHQFGINAHELSDKVKIWKEQLLKEREKRPRPRLDDKSLTSWNALMIKGYVDAYKVFGEKYMLEAALQNARFIKNEQFRADGGLNHSYKDGKSTINGFLEDYAATVDAFIALYEATLDKDWLYTARSLTDYTFDHFFDQKSHMFFFTSNQDESLVSRSIEKADNVIPASNSIMANNLFKLSHYFGNAHYAKTSLQMLHNMVPDITQYPSSHSNWLLALMNQLSDYYEIAVVGPKALDVTSQLNKHYIPNKLVVGSTANSDLYLLENRYVEGETLIYVCVNSACKLPVTDIGEAINQLNLKL